MRRAIDIVRGIVDRVSYWAICVRAWRMEPLLRPNVHSRGKL